MKDNRCFVCKYQGADTPKENVDQLFGVRGKHHHIPLCYNHSVELYKHGQTSFAVSYKHIFKDHYGNSEDKEIIDVIMREQKAANEDME